MEDNKKSVCHCDCSEYHEHGGVGVFIAKSLAFDGLTHGFTTRKGGVSPAPFDSLNLGMTRDDPPVNVDDNFHRLCDSYGLVYEELALVNHEHGANVIKVDGKDGGRGIYRRPLPFSDGLVTNDPNVTLVTSHADCYAIFMYDPKTRCIGLAHAGWKGMLARIGQKLAEKLAHEYSANMNDIIAVISPGICVDCFEVDAELGERFAAEFKSAAVTTPGDSTKAYVSLPLAAGIQLIEAGIPRDNISFMKRCTYEEKENFFSYRRDGEATGSMAAYIRLR